MDIVKLLSVCGTKLYSTKLDQMDVVTTAKQSKGDI